MTQWKTARAWVRAVWRWSEDDQAETVRALCDGRGWKLVLYRASECDLETFVKAIRDTEVAVVARLDTLVAPKVKRPSHELMLAATRIIRRAGLVVDAASEASSDDEKGWEAAMRASLGHVSGGRRPLGKKRAKAMAAKSWAKRGPGVVKQWTADTPAARKLREKWEVVYKSRKFKSFEAARAALPEELRELSQKSIWTIFGARTK